MPAWRSPAAEQRYRDLDAALWQRQMTGPPPEAIDVPTSFGSTRAYRWPGDGTPVVFLHGMGDTSVRWLPYAERLGSRDVYAIDVMGDVGASTPTVGFATAADYTDWLRQTVAGLGIASPHVVGHSLGGYIALAHAMTDPVSSTTVFDPVGVVELRLVRFIASSVGALLGSMAPGPIRRLLARRLHNPLLLDEAAVRLLLHAQRNHPPKLPPLPVFTDDELASISSPLRALVGAETSAFDVERLVERLNTTVAGAEARLLPDASHVLTMSHVDDCLATLSSNLAPPAGGGHGSRQP